MIARHAASLEHVIDIPPAPEPARPLPAHVVDEIHQVIDTAMNSLGMDGILCPDNVRFLLDQELSEVANRNDLRRLGLTSYPHAELSREALAFKRIERRLGHSLRDFVPTADDRVTRPSNVPLLRDLALQSLVHAEMPSELTRTLRHHLGNSRQAPTETQTATLHNVLDTALATNFQTALAAVLRQNGGEPSRDAVFEAGRKRLRRHVVAHASSGVGLTIGMAAIASPTLLLGAWTRRLWITGSEQWSPHSAAVRQRQECFRQAIESCPIVPISRESLGPQKACADAAQSSCAEKFPVPQAAGFKYHAAAFGTGYLTLAYGLGAVLGAGSMAPHVFSATVDSMRAMFVLLCFPKSMTNSVPLRRRLLEAVGGQRLFRRDRPLAEPLHRD